MSAPHFTKHVIAVVNNDLPPSPMNTFHTVGDVDGDGRLDVVISGRDGRMVWLENRSPGEEWPVHLVDEVAMQECGGSLADLTGNGLLDIINGGDWRSTQIQWWENPGPAGGKWTRRVIADTGHGQFHDTLIGDVSGHAHLSLIFTNQTAPGGTTIYCVPLPRDPTVSPWPDLQIVASAASEANPHRDGGIQPEEGLALGDLNGDGRNEIVCGTHWYEYTDGGWRGHKFANGSPDGRPTGYLTPKIAIGDVDGDGRDEIVLSEGDPCIYGKTEGGKVAWFRPGGDIRAMWEEHVVEDFLLDAHSLQLGDLCGNGRLDIFVGEVGVVKRHTDEYGGRPPRLVVYENDGHGGFTPHVIDEGTGIHDAVLADVWGRGVLDIVGKPLHGAEKWHVHVWANDPAADSTDMDYRYLGCTGLKVSPVCLGCMTFGEGADEPTAHEMLDRFVAAGGNFIDTANNYAGGASEEIVGRWLAARGNRQQMIVGTKVRFPVGPGPNDVGLTRKHIMDAVEASLRRLQTDYIGLYQAHCWDHITPLEETLRAFDDLVAAGKVRYIGASNFTGWHLAKAVATSAAHGWVRFGNLQTQYSLITRSPEWDILPACRAEGVGVTIWSPLGAGWLSGKYRRDEAPPPDSRMAHAAQTPEEWEQFTQIGSGATIPHPHRIASEAEFKRLQQVQESERRWRIIEAVGDVAQARGATHAQVALAWLLAQPGVTAPVIGARTVAQLEENLGCLDLTLSDSELGWLNEVSDPGLPYPHDFLAQYGPWR